MGGPPSRARMYPEPESTGLSKEGGPALIGSGQHTFSWTRATLQLRNSGPGDCPYRLRPHPGMDPAPHWRVRRTVRHGRQPAEEGAGTGRVARAPPHSGGGDPRGGGPPPFFFLKVVFVTFV